MEWLWVVGCGLMVDGGRVSRYFEIGIPCERGVIFVLIGWFVSLLNGTDGAKLLWEGFRF